MCSSCSEFKKNTLTYNYKEFLFEGEIKIEYTDLTTRFKFILLAVWGLCA